MGFYLTRHCTGKWTNLELTSGWFVFYQIQVYKLTTQRLARHRTQILNLTSKRFVFSMNRITCHRIYVIESTTDRLTCHKIQVYDLTSNQAMCSVDRLTYHRTQLINLTSNRAICQMPLPCPLTFRASSIKHWIPIQIPPPFHYPNTPYQIPHQVHPHRPKRQSQTTNRLTNPHSICTSTPSKERVQATNNRLLTTLYLYIPSFGFLR